MSRHDYKHIEPRFRRDDEQAAESRSAAQDNVRSAMVSLFGDKKYSEGFEGGSGWTSGFGGSGNGMQSSGVSPSESPAWRRRLEKAKREIAEHQREIRLKAEQERRDEAAVDVAATVVLEVKVESSPVNGFREAVDSFQQQVARFFELIKDANDGK